MAATVAVDKVVRGEVARPSSRSCASCSISAPGWGFPTDVPMFGVYFLDTSDSPAAVLDPVDPSLYQPRLVERVLDR